MNGEQIRVIGVFRKVWDCSKKCIFVE